MHGGYRLSREAAINSLAQIAEAMAGPVAVTDCIDRAKATCTVSICCLASHNRSRVNQAVNAVLNDVSLEDLISPAQSVAPVGLEQVMDHKAPSAHHSETLS